MNYYEHHIGDYDSATAHLTWLEDMAYRRLLCLCYRTEAPIPADIKQACRLVRATSKPEREAVQQVLEEFFELREDGWHNKRADSEVQRYNEGAPERELKKANEANRLKRHRDERAALFKVITDAGYHAPWNMGMNELRSMAERVAGHEPVTPETAPETLQVPEPETPPATAPATLATATQTPLPRHQTPVVKSQPLTSPNGLVVALPSAGADPPPAATPKSVPFAEIVAAYHELLPMCPRVQRLTETRKGRIRQRWLSGELPDVETWRKFFDYVARSRFLTGQTPGSNGRPPFLADLEWLTTQSHFVRVWEGHYHRDAGDGRRNGTEVRRAG